MKDQPIPSPYFRPLEQIPESGIYRVFHGSHRVAHDVTLIRGEQFPECEHCGTIVHFELLRMIPSLDQDSDFKVRLYKVPHPEGAVKQQKLA